MTLTREELREIWEAQDGRNKHRPAVVRTHREAFVEHTETSDAVPDTEASLAEFRDWLDRYRGTITRQLNDDTEGTDPHDEE